ncbi:hypothetical protein TNCV_488741 [Trichonephila clavipes]|nr:hypothetical protein TNCV_488741 [Trichonephila clavipes]
MGPSHSERSSGSHWPRVPELPREPTLQFTEPHASHEVGGRGRDVGGPDHPKGILLQNWGETELNRSATCMGLKATANDKRHLALHHDEFRGP